MRVQVGNPTSEKVSVRREVFRREKQIVLKPTHTTLQLKKKADSRDTQSVLICYT